MRSLFRTLPFLFVLLIAFSGLWSCKKEAPGVAPGQDTTKPIAPGDSTKPQDSTKLPDTTDSTAHSVALTDSERVAGMMRSLVGRKFRLSYSATRYRSEAGISSSNNAYNREFFFEDTLYVLENRYTGGVYLDNRKASKALFNGLDSALFLPRFFVNTAQDSFVGLMCGIKRATCSVPFWEAHWISSHRSDSSIAAADFSDYHNYYNNNPDPLVRTGLGYEIQYYFKKDSIVLFKTMFYLSRTEAGDLVEKYGEYNVMYGKGL